MFGPRLNTVFASRWRALWFAASILVTAYCSVPAPDEKVASPAAAPSPAPTRPWFAPDN